MAVAHSAASESHTGTTGSTNQAAFSWTHTQTGTPQGVVVFVSTYASVASLITSVTYGGVALTRLTGGSAQDGAGELGRMDAFFLGSGLSSGNQTITVNRVNNATAMYAAAATVTAGANTAVPTATIVLLQGDGTLTVQSVDDTSPGQNSVRYAGGYSGLAAPPAAGTGSTLLNSIDIVAYGSALVRETTAGQGARDVGFSAATDDRAVVHLAIRELVPRTETPIVGTFTLTGNDATLTVAGGLNNYTLSVDTGTFALTGNPVTLADTDQLEAATGNFALDGQSINISRSRALPAGLASFAFTGNNADPKKGLALNAEAATFALAGNNAALSSGFAVATGAFALNAEPASFIWQRAFTALTGQFDLVGNQANLIAGRLLAVDTSDFALIGNSVALTKVNAYQLSVEAGSFNLTPSAAALTAAQLIDLVVGSYDVTGNPVTLVKFVPRRRNVLIF